MRRSSSNSLLAQSKGSSLLSNFPAGISKNTFLGPYLNWRMRQILPSLKIGTIHAAPG